MYKCSIILKQETPMIHFESKVPGATLRATELKPKIDRWIKERLMIVNKELYDLNCDLIEKMMEEKTKSLYQIRIINEGTNDSEISLKYTPYFGDIGSKEGKKGLFTTGDIELRISSFDKKILEFVHKIIPYVFVEYNFGMRQNKGFGCFYPTELYENNQFESYIKRLQYPIWVKRNNNSKDNNSIGLIKKIQEDYQKIKSGVNHNGYQKSQLMEYFFDKDIRWEKYAIKANLYKNHQEKFDDLKVDDVNRKASSFFEKENEQVRYIRALLGLAEHNEYMLNSSKEKLTITIKDINENKQEVISRFQSPLTFKIFNDAIYLMAKEIPEEIFDHQFQFQIEKKRLMDIKTPRREEFDLQEFLDQTMKSKKFAYEKLGKMIE